MKMQPSVVPRLQSDSSEEKGVWYTMARLSGNDTFQELAVRWNPELKVYQFVIGILHHDDEDDFHWLGTDSHEEASMLFCKKFISSNF